MPDNGMQMKYTNSLFKTNFTTWGFKTVQLLAYHIKRKWRDPFSAKHLLHNVDNMTFPQNQK